MIPKNLLKQFKNGVVYTYTAPTLKNLPTICFIPGFKSDFISSKKSNFIRDITIEKGYGFLSWNHSNEGSVFDWYKDGLQLLQEYRVDYMIGASMGLWISLLLNMDVKDIRGIMGIGGGVDFTERWLNEEVPLEHRNDIDYIWKRPSRYDEKGYYEIPVRFLIESKPALLSNKRDRLSKIKCPVYLVHGDNDQDVSGKETYAFLAENIRNVEYFEINGGDHQLSREQDLAFIKELINKLLVP